MKPCIHFRRSWFDNDVARLRIESSDGNSLFSNEVYAAHEALNELVEGLRTFRHHVHGGIYDIMLGAFGPEYAGGAFHARLHFQPGGKILITVKGQSEFEEFGIKTVASEATLYLRSEPALLDNFVTELNGLKAGHRDDAYFEAIQR